MPDVLTPTQHHRCMSHIRSKATKPEILVRKWLWAHGYRYRLNVKSVPGKPDTVHWFLDDINDVRSSLFLEDAASEFDVQGLELDWTYVVWDGDLRYTPNGWNFFEFNGGNKWNNIKKSDRQAYLINAYRVLLTRARQGMIICVPEGNSRLDASGQLEDKSRDPKIYDATFNYLKSLGLEEI